MSQSPLLQRLRERRRARKGLRHVVGMTLLEIMIVLAILGLVIGIFLGPQILDMFGEAKEDVAKIEVQKYTTDAFFRWERRNPDKKCPASVDELAKILKKKTANDPWGNPYIMKCGDQAPDGQRLGIQSMGPDGKENTSDDIKSWD